MKSNRPFKIVIYFFLIIFLTGCNNSTQETLTPFGVSSESSYTIGFGVTSDKAISNKNFTFSVNSSEAFTPEINIINDTPFENDFSLIFLLDYNQTPIITDNEEKLVIEKKIKPVSEEKFQVSLPKLTSGRHDFLVLLIRKSEDINSDSIYMYRRGTLIVDNDKDVKLSLNNFDSVKNTNLPEEVIFLSKNVPDTIYDSVSNLAKQDNQNLYLNFHSDANQNYVVLPFLNNNLINESITNNYISIEESGNIHFPISTLNNLQSYNELFFVIVENPYQRVEDDNGTLKDIPWDVKFSDKIIIK